MCMTINETGREQAALRFDPAIHRSPSTTTVLSRSIVCEPLSGTITYVASIAVIFSPAIGSPCTREDISVVQIPLDFLVPRLFSTVFCFKHLSLGADFHGRGALCQEKVS